MNKIEKIKPHPIVSMVKQSPTKMTNGNLIDMAAPEIQLTRARAVIPIKKLTLDTRVFETQNNLGSTLTLKNNLVPFEIDSAAVIRPWLKKVIVSTPAKR
jgi:hypothetical protein